MKFYLRLIIPLIVLPLFLSAQKQKVIYKKTPSGLEYAVIKKGRGIKVKKGDRIYVQYATFIKPDSIFDSSKDKPYAFILGQEEVLKGWDEGIELLYVGDSASFKIPPSLAYGSKKIGKIPANTTVILGIKVLKAEQAFYETTGKDTIKFSTGLKKILVTEGIDEIVKPFNNVSLQFTGYVLNQKKYKRVFQSSQTNSALAIFQLGASRFVKGLDQGIATMKVNEKAHFIVPPELGFGKETSGVIPGNSTLYFDIEVLECRNPFFITENKDTIITKNGIKILQVLKQNEGPLINYEDVVSFDYTGYYIDSLGNPIIFDNTIERQQPALMRPNLNGAFPGLGEGLTHLKNGEEAKIIIPPKLINENKGKGAIPPNRIVVYDVHILKSQPYPFYDVKGLDTLKLNSGLKYIQVRKGSGLAVDSGSHISLAYTGFVRDSLGFRKIFDASRESRKLLDFIIGKGTVIKGFDMGTKGMTVGEGRHLIIPSNLGYGEKGIPEAGIPPNATLYFDIELIEVLKK